MTSFFEFECVSTFGFYRVQILFIGDIVGAPGRQAIKKWLFPLVCEYQPDVVIANAENIAGGLGATAATLRELFDTGVHVATLGNHVWRRKELIKDLETIANVVRPANYPGDPPGKGAIVYELSDGRKLGIINLLGRTFMEPLDCPFEAADRVLNHIGKDVCGILVDFHAEATSEKVAMGFFLDGRCSAVVGTHTHVQTADERVLPKGTAYITDVGMTGPLDSVIGVESDLVIHRFRTGMPVEFKVAKGRVLLNAVLIMTDDASGLAKDIKRISLKE